MSTLANDTVVIELVDEKKFAERLAGWAKRATNRD